MRGFLFLVIGMLLLRLLPRCAEALGSAAPVAPAYLQVFTRSARGGRAG